MGVPSAFAPNTPPVDATGEEVSGQSPAQQAFKAQVVTSFEGSPRTEERQSCVLGQVRTRDGRPVAGAVLYGNNGVTNTAQAVSDTEGRYSLCGLGDSRWSIVLTYLPTPHQLGGQVKAEFYVSGAPEQQAVVDFMEGAL